nr:MAG TPA: minor tail protein [Bacteriophage sp.]
MGTEIDRLEIQIEARASKANRQLDELITKLGKLSGSLSSINSGGMRQFAAGMNDISSAAKHMSTVKATEINRVVNNLQKLSAIKTGNMFNVGNALSSVARGMQGLSGISAVNISEAVAALSSLSKLGNKGVKNATSVMPLLSQNLRDLTATLNTVGVNGDAATQLLSIATAAKSFGHKNVSTGIANMPALAKGLKDLMQVLSSAPKVSSNLIAMTNALANLAANGSKVKTASNAVKNIGNSSAKASGHVNVLSGAFLAASSGSGAFTSRIKNATSMLVGYSSKMMAGIHIAKNFSSTFSNAYINIMRLARALRIVGKATEASMDYIETYNYYGVTMSKIASEFSGQWKQLGYDSAEEYGDSFASRLNELTRKMSGYKVGNEGMLSISGGKNLSLDPEQLMSYQSNVAAITNSVGLVGETSVNTAKALSMLAADMSSLKNIDMSTVMTNFQSGLIGQSRALYKYGIDITNATLQTYAYKYGLQTAVSEMTQADKMQLRLLAILDQSKVAWGDQANTLNSVANQYRILKQQLANIARVVGNLLIPALQAVLPVVNGILIAFQKLVNFVGGAIFGDKWKNIMDGISGGYGGADDAIGDLMDDTDNVVDGTDGIGDSLDNATDKAKKLQRTLLGFDEINKLNDNSDTSGSSGTGAGNSGISSGGTGGIDLSGAIASALADYESIWNKALENSQNKAQEYADKIAATFNKMWRMIKSGDFEGLGEYIAGGVDYVFKKINSVFNWDKLGPGITKFVDGYTRTINSLVDNIDWDGIGKTLGDGLNVITNTVYRYLTGIDWVNIGAAIATGLNGMIEAIDWDILGRTIGAWIMKIPKIVYGFVTTLDWSSLGTGIGNAINGALMEFDGKTIAGAINGIVNGILTALSALIRTVDWSEVVKAIGDVLGNLDWGALAKVGLAIGVAKLAKSLSGLLVKALNDVIGDKIKNWIVVKLLPTISGVFASGGAIGRIGSQIASSFSGIASTITGALSGVGTAIITFLGGLSGPVLIAAGLAIAGIIAVICNWDKVKEFFTQTLPNWWNETVVPWIQGLPEFFKELPGKIWEKIIAVKDKFVEWASQLYETVSEGLSNVIDKIVEFFAGLPEKIGYAIGFVLGRLAAWTESIDEWVNENVPIIVENIVTFFKELPGKIWDAIISAKDKLVEWAGSIWEYLSTKIPELIEAVVEFFRALPGKIWEGIKGAIDKVGEWCSSLYNKVVEEVPKIVDKVIEFFKELPGKIFEIGKNIVSGFIDGIKEKWASAKENVGEFVDGIVRGFKDGFDVHSPSRVMRGIGENVAAGLKNGIDGSSLDVLRVMDRLGENLRNSINQSLSDMESRTARMMSSLKEEFSTTVREADASAGDIIGAFSGLHIPIPHLSVSWDKWSIGDMSFSVPDFDINWYAKGGFPGKGELFLARESGPEMVGRMGSKNAVANNNQITNGIANAVYPAVKDAMMEVMMAVNSGNKEVAPVIDVVIKADSETVYKISKKGEAKYNGRYQAIVSI